MLADIIFNIFRLILAIEDLPQILTDKNLHTFEQLFRELFKPLCNFSLKYVGDWDEAKGLMHDVFVTV